MSDKSWAIRLVETPTSILWWREDGNGYSDRIEDAGLFSEERARKQDGTNRMGPRSAHDEAVSPADLIRVVEDEIVVLKERLDGLRGLQDRIEVKEGPPSRQSS